jgi:aminomethyltransferase
VKFDKPGDFSGRASLAAEKKDGSPRRVVFFRTGDRRIIRPDTLVVGADGSIAGRVLSGTLSPMLSEAIGSALVEAAAAAAPLHVDVRGSLIELQLVKPPFVPLKKPS